MTAADSGLEPLSVALDSYDLNYKLLLSLSPTNLKCIRVQNQSTSITHRYTIDIFLFELRIRIFSNFWF